MVLSWFLLLMSYKTNTHTPSSCQSSCSLSLTPQTNKVNSNLFTDKVSWAVQSVNPGPGGVCKLIQCVWMCVWQTELLMNATGRWLVLAPPQIQHGISEPATGRDSERSQRSEKQRARAAGTDCPCRCQVFNQVLRSDADWTSGALTQFYTWCLINTDWVKVLTTKYICHIITLEMHKIL